MATPGRIPADGIGVAPVDVKICGVTRPEDARAAVHYGASAVGMILASGTPRTVDLATARAIVAEVPDLVWRVGVFVAPDPERVREAVDRCGLSHVQLHAVANIDAIRQAVPGVQILESIRVDGPEALVRAMASTADLVLLDAAVPGRHGGTGMRFDWTLLDDAGFGRDFVLAGGLTPDNVGEAVRRTAPRIVDVSSGVESAPGVKDHDLIERFITRARASE